MSEIKLIQLNNYVKPKLEENKSKNWVLNGRNNEFYQYIIDRFNGSVTNHAVITAYSNLIYGQGLFAKDSNLKVTDWVRFKSMLSQKELRKIISDYQLFGEASLQIIKSKDRKSITGIYHLPKQFVAPSLQNDDGEIETYWYNENWQKPNDAVFYPAFGTSKDEIEIYCIKPYSAGKNYFSDPDYLASLQYAEMEEEISNFYNNFLKNGLSAGYIINVPDGQSMTPEEKDDLERQIKAKLTGSPNAGKFVLNFASKDAEITVIPFPTNENMHKQWEFLSNEARQQIMTGHLLTSPMLVGIKDSTGLGNNANELDEAESQLLKRVIAPKQIHIIEALDEILAYNGMAFDFYFESLSSKIASVDESFTGIQISSAVDIITKVNNNELSIEQGKSLLKSMLSYPEAELNIVFQNATQLSEEKKKTDLDIFLEEIEDNLENYELVDSRKVDYEDEDELDAIIEQHNVKLSTSTGTARPNAIDKEQDTKKFKVRYRYSKGLSSNSREFCTKMVNANKLYRKSDIERMSNSVVNAGWGPEGADKYDIFKYKGGGDCHHYWIRETYRAKSDINSPLAEQITPAQARKEGEILPTNDKLVYIAPKDMPYNGFLPTNKRFK